MLPWLLCAYRYMPKYDKVREKCSDCHTLTLTLTLTLSLFNQPKNHLPPYLVADEKPYILTITHTTYSG
jgi:hypothetical protein